MHSTLLSDRASEGDAAAFLEMVQRTYAPAIAFARTRSATHAEAESLLLDAYVAVFVGRHDAPADRDAAWVLRAVMSECAARTPARRAPAPESRWRARARGLLAGAGLRSVSHAAGSRSARCAFRVLAPIVPFVIVAACRDYGGAPFVGVIAPPATVDTSSMVSGDTVRVRNGRTTIVVDGARLTLVRVESESRCPSNVVCVWAGDVALRVRAEQGTLTVDSVLHLNRQSGRDRLRLPGLLVHLVSVEPYPVAGRPTPDSAYVARFVVWRGSGDAPGSPRDSAVSDAIRRSDRRDAENIAIRFQRAGRTPARRAIWVPASTVESP